MKEVVEYGQKLAGGGMQTLPDTPEINEIYPIEQRIANLKRYKDRVYMRKVIIVEDWTEI